MCTQNTKAGSELHLKGIKSSNKDKTKILAEYLSFPGIDKRLDFMGLISLQTWTLTIDFYLRAFLGHWINFRWIFVSTFFDWLVDLVFSSQHLFCVDFEGAGKKNKTYIK